jgi:hypothetical protein
MRKQSSQLEHAAVAAPASREAQSVAAMRMVLARQAVPAAWRRVWFTSSRPLARISHSG